MAAISTFFLISEQKEAGKNKNNDRKENNFAVNSNFLTIKPPFQKEIYIFL